MCHALCGMPGESGSIFNPASPHAQAISDLFVVTLWICAAIFAVVAGIVGYSLARYRWREGERDPKQVAGNTKVEIAWTVIPFLIVLVLFGLTVRTMSKSDPPPPPDPDLVVVGHQWWWEVRDPKNGFVTANEIHIPVGKPVSVQLDSMDVLHEFWVPRLTRKMTTIPGAKNHIWMQADEPGVYEGVCSEFCGTQHAWMRFLVVAESDADYRRWVELQKQPAAQLAGESLRGRELFQRMTCVSCHSIRDGAARPGLPDAGPDLTHVASRRQLGSGIVQNTPDNLRRWMADPQAVKPGVKMPNFKLSEEEMTAIVAYLGSLK